MNNLQFLHVYGEKIGENSIECLVNECVECSAHRKYDGNDEEIYDWDCGTR